MYDVGLQTGEDAADIDADVVPASFHSSKVEPSHHMVGSADQTLLNRIMFANPSTSNFVCMPECVP